MIARISRAGVAAALVLVALIGCALISISQGPKDEPGPVPEDLRGVLGTLTYSAFGEVSEGGEEPDNQALGLHSTVYVNGRSYSGMEDNDLRGFLDGRFKNGWNQVGQYHVRAGRREGSPKHGEHELMRVLYRWGDIRLPLAAHIGSAKLRLSIERGPPFDLSVYLYSVNKDWDPGLGGVLRDSTSPPKKGEVWWNDVAFEDRPWGLPGVGFASTSHLEADTPLSPLAIARFTPGQGEVEFSSARLTRYLNERTDQGRPFLFLLKLSDFLEDSPKTRLYIYSGNSDDDRNTARRPQLSLRWSSDAEIVQGTQEIFLEHGRTLLSPRTKTEGASMVSATFRSEPGYELPTLEVRGGDQRSDSEWVPMIYPVDSSRWEWFQIRIRAVHDPVELGQAYEARFGDTWVTSAAPAEQKVLWTFVSPGNREYEVLADHLEDFQWSVRFEPDEIGRWRYSWTHGFTATPFSSARGYFDVVGGDAESVRRELLKLRIRILDAEMEERADRMAAFEWQFVKLERAAVRLETPESFRSPTGVEMRVLLDEVRGLIWGAPIPEVIPLESHERDWWSEEPVAEFPPVE